MTNNDKTMMSEKMMGMCMCHDCSTMKECNINMDGGMPSQKGMFCSMETGCMMPSMSCMPKSENLNCMCTTCKVPSDMGMNMMNSPCMGKK
jgi:hypothetical protein